MVFFFVKKKTAYERLRSLVGSEMCIRDRARAVGTAAQLRQELLRACNDFLARYPDTDRDGIVEAVDRFREDVQRSLL